MTVIGAPFASGQALETLERPPPNTYRKHSRSPDLSIIVPTFNEVENVPLIVAALEAALAGIAWEVIFVDDDSPDGTSSAVRELARSDARVRGIRRVRRRGLAGAAIEGMLSASGDVVAIMDGDLQHDERLLPDMFEKIAQGADLVVASRYAEQATAVGGLSRLRLWGSETATAIAKRCLGLTASDPLSGFFMIRREALETIAPKLSTHGFKILLDILASSPVPLKTSELPFEFRRRQFGASKLDGAVAAEYLSLLLAKLTGDRISPRFVMFGFVGAVGVAVHLVALRFALASQIDFALAQMIAAYTAMTWNFFLNNTLTYRDRRLTGWGALTGLISFYAVCSVGMAANVGVGQLIYAQDGIWWLAGIAGALMGAVFNYVATSVFTWRRT